MNAKHVQTSPNIRIIDLVPGDLVINGSHSAVYVAQTVHPLYAGLQLVIWKLEDDTWSHDALSPIQEVGDVVISNEGTRRSRLREAFHGKG